MKYCSRCNAELDDNVLFCSNCGAKLDYSEKAQKMVSASNDNDDKTAEFDKEDVKSNTVMAVLSYLGILCFIPLIARRNSPYTKFHTNQGLVLFILSLVTGVLIRISPYVPLVGSIFELVVSVIDIALLLYMIAGIVNAIKGRAKELPLICKIKIIK